MGNWYERIGTINLPTQAFYLKNTGGKLVKMKYELGTDLSSYLADAKHCKIRLG
jgi:hypothetical protein